MSQLLTLSERGLYSPQADLYIDPWKPVPRALITHAHGDHARWGSEAYLCSQKGEGVLRIRLHQQAKIESLAWEEKCIINGVSISFHPAGHILGSAQIRLEYQGEVAVVSGDYKTVADRTCDAFQPIRCHTFVTESTFGLPVYRWREDAQIFQEIHQWWEKNRAEKKVSVIFAYSLGKAQRVLSGLDATLGPIGVHQSVAQLNQAYIAEGVALPPCVPLLEENLSRLKEGGIVVAPPALDGSNILRKLGSHASSFASGWMQIRGQRRRRGMDRGFVLSDHADWPGLLSAVEATGAENIWVTHGQIHPFVRYLREQGKNALPLNTQFHSDLEHELEDGA